LGIRTSVKENLGWAPANFLYGEQHQLPGGFIQPVSMSPSPDFVQQLNAALQLITPYKNTHSTMRPVFVPQSLSSCTHVFLRVDSVKRPLQQPYKGPYKVLQRDDKVITLDINGEKKVVSLDRVKPHFTLAETDS